MNAALGLLPAWLLLLFAIFSEVGATTALKVSNGFTRPVASVVVVVGYLFAFWMFALVLKRMDIGIAYALWSGLGVALVALVGIFFFGESMNWIKAFSLVLVVVGLVGLNISSGQ